MIDANTAFVILSLLALFAKILDSIDWHSVDPVQRELLVRKLQSIINFLDENNEKAD